MKPLMALRTKRMYKSFFNVHRRFISNTVRKTTSSATYEESTTFNQLSTSWNCKRNFSLVRPEVISTPQSLLSEEEKQEFKSYFQVLVQDLTTGSSVTDIPDVTNRFRKVLDYNVPHGKQHRGQAVVAAYKAFAAPENLTSENLRLANILGWSIEVSQASLLIEDDIEDQSEVRHGLKAWHLVDGVGNQAIFDLQMLEKSFFIILKKYFSDKHCYIPMFELYNDIMIKTRLGQSLDCLYVTNKDMKFTDYFSKPTYTAISKYKTGYQGFVLPIVLSMYFAETYNPAVHDQVTRVLLDMGLYYQVENDVLDCYGDATITGKTGNDITQGKCTWLIIEALQRVNPHQKELLINNYGKNNPESEALVRELYEELNLVGLFSYYKEHSYKHIHNRIEQMWKDVPHEFFFQFLKRIFKRG